MDKYNILDGKLLILLNEVDEILNQSDDHYIEEYLNKYKAHVNRLRKRIIDRTIGSSTQGLLGVQRAISENDSLCINKKLYLAACEVERYYEQECKTFS